MVPDGCARVSTPILYWHTVAPSCPLCSITAVLLIDLAAAQYFWKLNGCRVPCVPRHKLPPADAAGERWTKSCWCMMMMC